MDVKIGELPNWILMWISPQRHCWSVSKRLLLVSQKVCQREERGRRWGFYSAGSFRPFQLLPVLQGIRHECNGSATEDGPVWTPHS